MQLLCIAKSLVNMQITDICGFLLKCKALLYVHTKIPTNPAKLFLVSILRLEAQFHGAVRQQRPQKIQIAVFLTTPESNIEKLTGVAAGDELDVGSVTHQDAGTDEGQIALSDAAFVAVTELYQGLEAAIKDPSQRMSYQQPWKQQ